MKEKNRTISVFEHWSSSIPVKIGYLYIDHSKGTDLFSFEYDEEFLLTRKFNFILDPDLEFYPGRQFVYRKPNFGIFSDSAPDRWGRVLMNRREAVEARKEKRKPRKLTDADYLLGVFDETRIGALRFSEDDGNTFLSNDASAAAPPWTTLRSLEEASRRFEAEEDPFNDAWLNQLLKPGSSLGGARPKANVQATDGSLWIAKFPSKNDEHNTGAWEKAAHDLAGLCGLRVPPSKLETFSKAGSTFLVKRFDREGARRIHFSSAMTMLGKTDGASASDGSSYLEIAEFIRSNGSQPKVDLLELWKRIVFNMAISNTDDHLRNHGFLLTDKGWMLSPLYDVNPIPYGDTLSLNVTSDSNLIDLSLAIETASYYGLSVPEAKDEAVKICRVVRDNWEKLAARYGVSRGGIELMRPAFTACYDQ